MILQASYSQGITSVKTVATFFGSNQMNGVQEDRIYAQSGFRLKFGGKIDVNKLKCRNFPEYSEDSIDVEDIVNGKAPFFDPITMSHFRMSDNIDRLKCTNISSLEHYYGNEHKENIQPQLQKKEPEQKTKEQKVQRAEVSQAIQECEKNEERKEISEIEFEIDVKMEPVKEEEKQRSQSMKSSDQKKIEQTEENNNEKSQQPKEPQILKVEDLKQQFSKLAQHPPVITKDLKILAKKYKINSDYVLNLFKVWHKDPNSPADKENSAKSNSSHSSNSKLIRYVKDTLESNPFITAKQLSMMLFQKGKTSHKLKKEEILSTIKSAGYVKLKMHQNNENQMREIQEERMLFSQRYKELRNQGAMFYYFGEMMLHPYLDSLKFWGKSDQRTPKYSKKFLDNAIIFVAILSTNGLFWQIRGSDYSPSQYSHLLSQMLQKLTKKKLTKVVVIGQTPLRQYQQIKYQVDKVKALTIPAPTQSPEYNPLQMVFDNIKQQFKSFREHSKVNIMQDISAYTHSLSISYLRELITKCRKNVENTEIKKNK